MRCASPPESVGAGRPSVRYSKPDVDQELQPVANLAQSARRRSFARLRSSFQASNSSQQFAQRHAAEFVDRAAAKPHGRGVVAQPAAAADRAFDFVDQVFQLRCARPARRGSLLPAPDKAPCIESGTDGGRPLRRFRAPPACDTSIHCSPVPCKTIRRWRPLSCSNGTSSRHAGAARQGVEHRARTAALPASGQRRHGALGPA